MKLMIFIPILLVNFIAMTQGFALTNSEPENMSTREFCKTSGGRIKEMGSEHVHMCCYQAKQKCLVIDQLKGYSQLIPLTFGHTAENNDKENM